MPTNPTDDIDLRSAVFHSSPDDVKNWPITVHLEGVEFKPGAATDGNTCGVRPIADRTRWPDLSVPGVTGPGDFLQFTLWVFVKVNDVWHGAGLQEFWRDRDWSGAPILTQWFDWVYRNQWGSEMEAYRPRAGDEIAFMVVAGDNRLIDVRSVKERSQVLKVKLVATGIARSHSTPPPPPPAPLDNVEHLISEVRGLAAQVEALTAAVKALRS